MKNPDLKLLEVIRSKPNLVSIDSETIIISFIVISTPFSFIEPYIYSVVHR